LTVERDTLTGVLNYAGRQVAMGTMQYKHTKMDHSEVLKSLQTTACNLKLIPGPDFKPQIAQIVSYNLQVEKLHHAWIGPARLSLNPHVNAPTADLPVRKILYGKHIKA
jgi:acetoacetate decarboxylase